MRISFPLAFLAAVTLATSACQRVATKGASEPPSTPVEVATAEARTMPIEMQAIGVVEPIASVQLKSKVQGEILRVHFADGAEVREGDALFDIDARPFEVALKRAQANLAMARSTADNASEQAERYTTLIKRGVASKEQFSQYLATAESQRSELEARQADVDEAQLSLNWSQVRSPISGRTGSALLKPGNIVNANADVLTIINQMEPIYVAFSLNEGSLQEVRNWIAQGKPVVSAREPDTHRLLGTGELTFVDNKVDRVSGMIAFKATFPNENDTLWPGQFVDVTVKLADEPDVVVVPTTAIMESQTGAQVFVVSGNTAKIRQIRVGRTVGNSTIVNDGLNSGELVVTSGQFRIQPGGKVTVVESKRPEEIAENAAPAES